MPDRTDPTQYDYTNESSDFAEFPTGVPEGAPLTRHDQFADSMTLDLPEGSVVDSQPNNDVFASNPDQFFVAYRDRVEEVVVPVTFNAASDGIAYIGAGKLVGYAGDLFSGNNSHFNVRDGLDGSSPLLTVLPAGMANVWFGVQGPTFNRGLFISLNGASSGYQGVLYVVKKRAV